MNIAVYLGSRPGDSPAYVQNAANLGRWIALNGFTLVYGGTTAGSMGALAGAALAAGGKVIGVLPEVDFLTQQAQPHLTQTILTPDVASRRSRMIELADAFVALPGGLGTLDEISEVLSLQSLDLIKQPVAFLGTQGYFEPFKALFEHMIKRGFCDRAYLKNVLFTEDMAEMGVFLRTHNIIANER